MRKIRGKRTDVKDLRRKARLDGSGEKDLARKNG